MFVKLKRPQLLLNPLDHMISRLLQRILFKVSLGSRALASSSHGHGAGSAYIPFHLAFINLEVFFP